jgi:hypothetical protein
MNGPRSLPQHLPVCDTSLQLLHRLVTAGQPRLTSQIRARSRERSKSTRRPFFSDYGSCNPCYDDLDAMGSELGLQGPVQPRTPSSGPPLARTVEGPPRSASAGRTGRPSLHGLYSPVTCSSLMLQTISSPPCAHLISHTGNPAPPPLSPNRHRSSTLVRFPRSGG